MKRPSMWLYRGVTGCLRAYQWLFMQVRVWGREHLAGPGIFVANHITSLDGWYLMPSLPRPTVRLAGQGARSPFVRPVLDALGMINAMPEARGHVVDEAVRRLRAGMSVLVFPEGDVSDPLAMGRFFPGFARMHLQSGVPIVPIGLCASRAHIREPSWLAIDVDGRTYRTLLVLRGPYLVNAGAPLRPDVSGCADERQREQRVIDQVRHRIEELVHEIRKDRYWLS